MEHMSLVSANAFLEKVKNDEGFRNKLAGLKDGQARLDFAKEAGFTFTVEELAAAKAEQGLSDDELDAVAGGCGGARVCMAGIGDSSVSLW
jgi:predicted ribosomally synthesized peptide with nif11-like leader